MKKIYSKIKPDTLLHLVHRLDEIEGRTNVAPENEFIQLATLKMEKGTLFMMKTRERVFCFKIKQKLKIIGSKYVWRVPNQIVMLMAHPSLSL